ncbi:hypothetical protein D3C71_2042070 [compost metagenome]
MGETRQCRVQHRHVDDDEQQRNGHDAQHQPAASPEARSQRSGECCGLHGILFWRVVILNKTP